jgi:hypothetical protein
MSKSLADFNILPEATILNCLYPSLQKAAGGLNLFRDGDGDGDKTNTCEAELAIFVLRIYRCLYCSIVACRIVSAGVMEILRQNTDRFMLGLEDDG